MTATEVKGLCTGGGVNLITDVNGWPVLGIVGRGLGNFVVVITREGLKFHGRHYAILAASNEDKGHCIRFGRVSDAVKYINSELESDAEELNQLLKSVI